MKTHLFGFKQRFVPKIEDGSKAQTIRSIRNAMPVVDDLARLFHGDRYHPVLIGFAYVIFVDGIQIDTTLDRLFVGNHTEVSTALGLDKFSRRDGFEDWADMRAFWRENHPDTPQFSGFLTRWRAPVRPTK